MEYKLVITAKAKKDIDRLDSVVKKKIGKKLIMLKDNPIGMSRKLVNIKIGAYRYRVGDYRVIFDLIGREIVILYVRHRREVYR